MSTKTRAFAAATLALQAQDQGDRATAVARWGAGGDVASLDDAPLKDLLTRVADGDADAAVAVHEHVAASLLGELAPHAIPDVGAVERRRQAHPRLPADLPVPALDAALAVHLLLRVGARIVGATHEAVEDDPDLAHDLRLQLRKGCEEFGWWLHGTPFVLLSAQHRQPALADDLADATAALTLLHRVIEEDPRDPLLPVLLRDAAASHPASAAHFVDDVALLRVAAELPAQEGPACWTAFEARVTDIGDFLSNPGFDGNEAYAKLQDAMTTALTQRAEAVPEAVGHTEEIVRATTRLLAQAAVVLGVDPEKLVAYAVVGELVTQTEMPPNPEAFARLRARIAAVVLIVGLGVATGIAYGVWTLLG